jgi:hypothetical protein
MGRVLLLMIVSIPMASLHAADTPRPVPLAGAIAAGAEPAQARIDRHALVTRHNIALNEVAGRLPLGNGEFCFAADGTGLQTFAGNSMSHWGWHSFPLPEGWTPDRVPPTGTFQQGRNTGPDVFPKDSAAIRTWMFDNPHIMNLGRLRLCQAEGAELQVKDISKVSRTLDLWSGAQISTYAINGESVRVETCVHPKLDAVAVKIESPLIARGTLEVAVDFPYPSLPLSRSDRCNVRWLWLLSWLKLMDLLVRG